MSVWPTACQSVPALVGSEGELVSARISVEPRLLERLLETLAKLPFPVNPQIYHHSDLVPVGERESPPATVVEFPAYSDRLKEVRDILWASGFDTRQLKVTSMLQEIQAAVE